MIETGTYHQTKEQINSDRDAVIRSQADPKAFEPLYRKYHHRIFTFIIRRVESEDMAAEITSNVFVKALSKINKFEFRGLPFSSWLYRIALSEVSNLYNTKKITGTVTYEEQDIVDIKEEIHEKYGDEIKGELITALRALSDEDLEIIELRYFEKRPFKEIGDILNITENNAKVKNYRVLEKLKKTLIS